MNILSIVAMSFAGLMMMEATRVVFMSAMGSLYYVEVSYRDERLLLPLLTTAFRFSVAIVIWALCAEYMQAVGLKIAFVALTFILVSWNMVMKPKGLSIPKFAFWVIILDSMFVLGLLVTLL